MSNEYFLKSSEDVMRSYAYASMTSNNGIDGLAFKDYGSITNLSGWMSLGMTGSGYSETGISVNPITALQSSLVSACIDKISSDIAKLPIKLMKKQDNIWEPVQNHSLLNLFKTPNKRQNRYELIYQIVMNYLLIGNGLCTIILDRSTGAPKLLVPMALTNTKNIIETVKGDIEYNVQSTLFYGEQTSFPEQHTIRRKITEEDMIHIRRASLDGIRGVSVLASASEVIGLQLACQAVCSKTFKNNASFQFIITTEKGMTNIQVENTQEQFMKTQSGITNAGKPPVMRPGTKIERISMDMNESAMLPIRDHVDSEICRLFGIPHSLMGISGDDSNTYKNLETDMRNYLNSTLMNIIVLMEEQFNGKLLDEKQRGNFELKFDTSPMLKADKAERYGVYNVGIASHIITPNEARAEEGLKGIVGGDEFPKDVKVMPPKKAKNDTDSTEASKD